MKKLIICLLLICTICLGCVGLAACDKHPTDDIPRNTFWEVENSPFYGTYNDCYAFFYTGEYKLFYIKYYYSHNGRDEESTTYDDYNMYYETLTNYSSSRNHSHIIKPNTVVYLPIYSESDYMGGGYIYHPTKLEYIAYDYIDGRKVNERIIFTTSFEFKDYIYINPPTSNV